jgi:chromosomal replication initiator protein
METVTESAHAETAVIDKILTTLHDRIGPQKFNAWFKRGLRLSLEDGYAKVSVPNPFVANWIETHYQAEISAAIHAQTGQPRSIVITVDPALSGQIRRRQLDIQADLVSKAAHGLARPRQPLAEMNVRYRLEDFVVGESNRLAYTAAMSLSSGRPAPFHHLFIHGSCGVGKTHLLQGICMAMSHRTGQPLRWRYVTGEQFTNEFIASLRQKKISDFRNRYRKLSLLAIDDVHFLSSKKATQDEFLHTFNAIEAAGNHIVLASDAHPRLVGDLNEQLVSRFVSGMVVKIDTPDPAMRMEILLRKARAMNLQAPREVLEYIAMHIRGSIRELEGALVKLAALAALDGGTVTLQMATDALADHLARTGSALTLGDIEAAVAAYFGITPADIHSSRRTKTVSVARMVAMFLARRHTRMSYPEIGKFMGKNHSSAVLAVQRMESILARNDELEWMTPVGTRTMPAQKVLELLTEQFA